MKAPMSEQVQQILANKRSAKQLIDAVRGRNNGEVTVNGQSYRVSKAKTAASVVASRSAKTRSLKEGR